MAQRSKPPTFLLLLIVLQCSSCILADVHIYRYVDDRTNLILKDDDYYAPLLASIPSLSVTTYRPPFSSSQQPTRYPVYQRPTIPARNEPQSMVSGSVREFTTPTSIYLSSTTAAPVSIRPSTVLPLSGKDEGLGTPKGNVGDPDPFRLENPSGEVFLAQGNSEDTVPLANNNGGSRGGVQDVIITEGMMSEGVNHVVLLCNASYPVEWIYEGVGAPTLYTTQIKTFSNFFNPKTYIHSNIIVLVQNRQNERQTGTYYCVGIHNPERRTGFHLYFKGESGFPSLQNVVIQPKSNQERVILPCPTTDPAGTVGLYRISSSVGESTNFSFRETFTYDPRHGFSMKLSDMSSPFGRYVCKFNDRESSWTIDVVRPKGEEVTVYPNTTLIEMDMHNLVDHKFICKAKEPIQIMLPNTVDLGHVKYHENSLDEFPFVAFLTVTPSIPLFSVANYFKINCQSRKSRRVLHTWEYSTFGTEVINVSYDKYHKRLLCCTKSGLTPIHEMAKCDTVAECNIKKSCFESGRCDYAFHPKFVDGPRGCSAVEFMSDFPSHILKCSVGGQVSVMRMVSSNVDNDNLLIYDGTVPKTEEILKLSYLKSYPNGVIEVRCVASIFYFSTNLVFAFLKYDRTITFADEGLMENSSSYGPTLKTIVPPDTESIVCFAPLTRSSEWRNATLHINQMKEQTQQPQTMFSSRRRLNYIPILEADPAPYSSNSADKGNDKSLVTSILSSTSSSIFLRKREGQHVRVMQDV